MIQTKEGTNMKTIELNDLQEARDKIYKLLFSGGVASFRQQFACYLVVDNLVMKHIEIPETDIDKFVAEGHPNENSNWSNEQSGVLLLRIELRSVTR